MGSLTRNRSSTFRLRQTRKSRADRAESPRTSVESALDSHAMRRLLVANRGEIALRIFRACRAEGVETVAVATPEDRGAWHVSSADTLVEISSYLDPAEHVRAAREAGADAVHPGYGFLSETVELAEAVLEAGLTWVGPPPSALAAGGDKLAAKETARAAGVPVLPSGTPEEIGFPLLVKAAAGGGGRGMRLVREPEELDEALAAARREAAAAFGDDSVFCERYLERPRHVEIQLLADGHGNVVPLGERDCSIQRRHQKVLEEAPSPALDPELRGRMSDAAVAFARAIGYESAGTAEFVLDGRDFWFLELNARIQVEHPVTELVTGIDIVREQLRIASGKAMSFQGTDWYLRGHAVEVRLYAEDPRSFLPQAGRLERLRLPDGIRVDSGVREGDEIGTVYDPMIAKLIASGDTRAEALDRLADALRKTEVGGVTTNLPFLRWLVVHPLVRAGRVTTAFLTENPPLSEPPPTAPADAWSDPWRLNLRSPPPRPAPDVDIAAGGHGPSGHEQSEVVAPMPGTVIRVLVEPGARVRARQPLVVLEAMKMETPLVSPYEATVRTVHVGEGDRVAGGAVLVELDE
jgi:3-methylcrotonyl-CoA carboxylase alpha subunit